MLKNTGMALGIATVLFTGATALAGPASAATVTAQVDGARILVNGSSAADGIELFPSGTFVSVSNTLGSVVAGPGCTAVGAVVRCPTTGVTRVDVFAAAGDDAIRNSTRFGGTLSGDNGNDTVNGGGNTDVLAGGLGDDTLSGNAGDDRLVGGPGEDRLNGGAGTDACEGELEVACEL
ncbi:calcium-binding protein [Nonomuraea rhizosphaerae]|uniref:calcium-binding protein n=1 Tax=Nonomuraea rhizosphaerae TaxID=2665663 RepID=UPI001C5F9093|nr:hypothetical protein [Nonomuraea rhizosphaerae]